MVVYDRRRLRQAVQFLVDSSYTHHHVKRLRSTVVRPRSMPFTGDAEVLNELLVVGRQNLSAMESLIALAESKRDSKTDYQRDYMATKRRRERKALLLEELMTGNPVPKSMQPLIIKHQNTVWNRERDALMQGLTDMAWAERNERLRQFWATKERELDALIVEAREHGPIKRKRVVRVAPKPKSEFGKKLAGALDRH